MRPKEATVSRRALWQEGKGASKDDSYLFPQVWLGKRGEIWSEVTERRWKLTVIVAMVEDSGALVAIGEQEPVRCTKLLLKATCHLEPHLGPCWTLTCHTQMRESGRQLSLLLRNSHHSACTHQLPFPAPGKGWESRGQGLGLSCKVAILTA